MAIIADDTQPTRDLVTWNILSEAYRNEMIEKAERDIDDTERKHNERGPKAQWEEIHNQTTANPEVVIAENFPELEKDIKQLIQEAPQIPGRITGAKKRTTQ